MARPSTRSAKIPKRKGLLFAGTEREVYVSFDDGDHWQSLRLNMPASSIRDLVVHDDDLVVATHGRGFWILDDITPLRQLNQSVAASDAFLFKPQTAIRVRWNMNTDTPLPPDEPASPNPPDGAILDYYLGPNTSGPVTLEILDSAGRARAPLLQHRPRGAHRSQPRRFPPTGCARRTACPPLPGMHRYLWDMHHTPLAVAGGRGGGANYSSAAVAHNTPPTITSIWAAPGRYTVKLTANGKSYSQPLTLKMDPRVKTPAVIIQQQSTISKQLYEDTLAVQKALAQMRALRAQIRDVKAEGAAAQALAVFDKQAAAIEGGGGGGRGGRGGGGGRGAIEAGPETLTSAAGSLTTLMRQLEAAEVAPTTQLSAAIADRRAQVAQLLAKWNTLKTSGLAPVNAGLKQANLNQLSVR